jgi:hypothetical protein
MAAKTKSKAKRRKPLRQVKRTRELEEEVLRGWSDVGCGLRVKWCGGSLRLARNGGEWEEIMTKTLRHGNHAGKIWSYGYGLFTICAALATSKHPRFVDAKRLPKMRTMARSYACSFAKEAESRVYGQDPKNGDE